MEKTQQEFVEPTVLILQTFMQMILATSVWQLAQLVCLLKTKLTNVCQNVPSDHMLIPRPEFVLLIVLELKDCSLIPAISNVFPNVPLDTMVTLSTGFAWKAVPMQFQVIDSKLAVYVLKNVPLLILLSFQLEHVFKIAVEAYMVMQWQEHAKTVQPNAQLVFLLRIVFHVLLRNIYHLAHASMSAS